MNNMVIKAPMVWERSDKLEKAGDGDRASEGHHLFNIWSKISSGHPPFKMQWRIQEEMILELKVGLQGHGHGG